MDGENNGKPYEQMDDLGGTTIFGNTHIYQYRNRKIMEDMYPKGRAPQGNSSSNPSVSGAIMLVSGRVGKPPQ